MNSFRPYFTFITFCLLAMLWLSACSIPSRQQAVPQAWSTKAEIPGLNGVRYVVKNESMPEIVAEGVDSIKKQQAYFAQKVNQDGTLPPTNVLALSGGGDDGAFGAGLLCGWSAAGNRPEFKVVTGVSTGSLIAPFAFLGTRYDEILRKLYTQSSPQDIFELRSYLAAVTDDAMSDNTPLKRQIEKYVTTEMLAEIAKEYQKGRLLFIATTNLDSRQAVLWNMTKLAASSHPDSLSLFQKIMLASSAIPGLFPPTMIDVEADGKRYQEMHVDGGAMNQVFIYPPEIKLDKLIRQLGAVGERRLYIIRNARIDPDWAETQRQTLSIANRAINSLIHTQGVGDLYRIYATAQRDGIDYNLAYIPENFYAPHKEDFDTAYMKKLFDFGYELATKGYAWKNVPPGM